MSPIFIILSLVLLIVCIGIVTMILLQKKKSAGLSSTLTGAGQGGDTYWDKNKGRSLEGKLEKYTKIAGGVFMVLSFILTILS